MNHSHLFISPNLSARDALRQLDQAGILAPVLFVLLEDRILGSLTDGDIRRGLLHDKSVDSPVTEFMHQAFRYLDTDYSSDDIQRLKELQIRWVPVLFSDKRLSHLIDTEKLVIKLPVTAVLMAGGRGERLRPLTDQIPKPLLPVGGKPILEHNLIRLRQAGITDFVISIRYLGDQIKTYFGDGSAWGVQIQYVEELEPLGTIGACGLVLDWANPHVMVMNADLLTNFSVTAFIATFLDKKADMMVLAIPYDVTIPYGVLETSDDLRITGIKEKPKYTFLSNAGIYLIQKDLFDLIPPKAVFHATDLLEKSRQLNKRVIAEPLIGYWLDMGRPEEYARAQEDIKRLTL